MQVSFKMVLDLGRSNSIFRINLDLFLADADSTNKLTNYGLFFNLIEINQIIVLYNNK